MPPPPDVQVTVPPSPDNDSTMFVGASGGNIYCTALDIADAVLLPAEFIATTVTA